MSMTAHFALYTVSALFVWGCFLAHKKEKVSQLINKAALIVPHNPEASLAILGVVVDEVGAHKLEDYLKKHHLMRYWTTWEEAHSELALEKRDRAKEFLSVKEWKKAKAAFNTAIDHFAVHNSHSNRPLQFDDEKEIAVAIDAHEAFQQAEEYLANGSPGLARTFLISSREFAERSEMALSLPYVELEKSIKNSEKEARHQYFKESVNELAKSVSYLARTFAAAETEFGENDDYRLHRGILKHHADTLNALLTGSPLPKLTGTGFTCVI